MTKTPWKPDKPADKYTADDIKKNPMFKAQQAIDPDATEAEVIEMCRTNIARMWKRESVEALKVAVKEVFSKLPNTVKVATIHRNGKLIIGGNTVEVDGGPVVARFSAKDWAALVVDGKPKKFVYTKSGSRDASRDGKYVLHVEKPIDGVSKKFSVRLIEPDGTERRCPINPKANKTQKKTQYKNLNELKAATGLKGGTKSIAKIFGRPDGN